MKIAVYASMIASERGHERNVSGHIQVPLESARRLRLHGHDVHLISNRFGDDLTLPEMTPRDVALHLVTDSRRRPDAMRGARGRGGVRPLSFLRQVRELKALVRAERFDVVHFFGYPRTGQLGGLLRRLGMTAPAVFTILGGDLAASGSRWSFGLLRRFDAIIAGTRYMADACRSAGLGARLIRHGIVRDLAAELGDDSAGPKHRVLFWRDPSPANGADLALAAFDEVAPEFPDVSFDFAIRPIYDEVPGLDDLSARRPNVHVYRFPYEDGITLPRLIAESLLVVMPFRHLSVNPQFAIAESVAAGVPVIASDLESNPEVVTDGARGVIVPVGQSRPIADALRRLLSDRDGLVALGRSAARDFASQWNWENYAAALTAVYEEVRGRIRR